MLMANAACQDAFRILSTMSPAPAPKGGMIVTIQKQLPTAIFGQQTPREGK